MASSSIIPQQSYTDLCQRVKPIVWIIRVVGTAKKQQQNVLRNGTAFAVNDNGVLLTCTKYLDGLKDDFIIHARRLDMDGFITNGVRVIEQRNRWFLCLLKVEGIVDTKFGNLVADGCLQEGNILTCVGNPYNCVGSFGLGHVLFPCVESITLPTGFTKCLRYNNSRSMEVTPEYRIMGHVWNMETLSNQIDAGLIQQDDCRCNLHPCIPIIQCGDLCMGSSCVGAPVFNSSGEIVGILASDDTPNQIAIHVTLIREFLRQTLS